MMQELLIHPLTQDELQSFRTAPSHALALIGPSGLGKNLIAKSLIATMLHIDQTALTNYPHNFHIQPEPSSISIEAVREIVQFTKLKTFGTASLRRFIVIEDAGTMTSEAQNALLKVLEEPPVDTLFILTITQPKALQATVLSRVQRITVKRPPKANVIRYFKALGYSEVQIAQAYNLSDGLPGLMYDILTKHDDAPLVQAINKAKQVLQMSTFERLATIDEISKDRGNVRDLIDALLRIAEVGLVQTATKQTNNLDRWKGILVSAYDAKLANERNVSTKLNLTTLLAEL